MKSEIDFLNNFKPDMVLETAVKTADANGSSVDRLGYERVTLLAAVGASGDTLSGSVYIELEVEESDDDSTFTDVVDANLSASVTGTNTGTFSKIDAAAEDQTLYTTTYKGSKRYVRPVVNVTGTHTNGTPIGIIAIRHGAHNLPVS